MLHVLKGPAPNLSVGPFPESAPFPFPGEAHYRDLLEASPMAFFFYDRQADSLTLSLPLPERKRACFCLDGFLASLPVCPFVPERLRWGVAEALRRYCASPQKGFLSLCLDLYGKRVFRWYRAFLCSDAEEGGGVGGVTGYLQDAQTEKQSALRLERLRMYRRAVDFASLFVYEFVLPGYELTEVSRRHENVFFPLEDYLSKRREALTHPDDLPALRTMTAPLSLANAFRAGQYELRAALRLMNRKGEWVWTQFTVHLSRGEAGGALRGIGYVQLIHAQKLLEERASLDAVTGLLNRATLEERVQAALCDSDGPCYFFLFDVDDFKIVNDTCGHAEGDAALRGIGSVLRAHTRNTDPIGRIGGDEFVALLCGMPSQEAALDRAEEILRAARALKSPARSRGEKGLSLSVGMAVSAPGQNRYDDLYRAADEALYRAKALGKNRCCAGGEN